MAITESGKRRFAGLVARGLTSRIMV